VLELPLDRRAVLPPVSPRGRKRNPLTLEPGSQQHGLRAQDGGRRLNLVVLLVEQLKVVFSLERSALSGGHADHGPDGWLHHGSDDVGRVRVGPAQSVRNSQVGFLI
jgi:hypothetical protein